MSLTHRNVGRRGFLGLAAGAGTAALATAAGPVFADEVARRPHRVVVYTRTAGFRHNSITVAIAALKELGAANGIEVVATEDPAFFTAEQLRTLTAVVFANTTGNVLTDPGRAALQDFVTAGGGWMGVHAAADTEYDWPFYTELLSGGRFLCHPLLNQRATLVRESATHLSTAHLAERWTIPTEEYYSFKTSVRGTAQVLLSIDERTYLQDPNTSWIPSASPPYLPTFVSGRMGDHPMCWQRPVGNGLSWYTALGHIPALYSNPAYRQHLLGGLLRVSRHGRSRLPV